MNIVSSHYSNHLLWIRLFRTGLGILIKDIRFNPLTFSERRGLNHQLIMGDYLIRFLRRVNLG